MYIKSVTNHFVKALITGFLIFSYIGAQAQLQYNFERINTDNGLSTNAIKGLQFDEKNRFLWVATESGILRYNGYGFQNFGDNEQTKVLDDRIVFFDKANDGKLFGKLMDERVFLINKNKAIIDTSIEKLVGQTGYLNYKYNLKNYSKKVKFSEIEHNDFIINNQIFSINNNHFYKYNLNQFDTLFKIPSSSIGFVLNKRIFIFIMRKSYPHL